MRFQVVLAGEGAVKSSLLTLVFIGSYDNKRCEWGFGTIFAYLMVLWDIYRLKAIE